MTLEGTRSILKDWRRKIVSVRVAVLCNGMYLDDLQLDYFLY